MVLSATFASLQSVIEVSNTCHCKLCRCKLVRLPGVCATFVTCGYITLRLPQVCVNALYKSSLLRMEIAYMVCIHVLLDVPGS